MAGLERVAPRRRSASRGDDVHVEIERPGSRRMQPETVEAGLLLGLPPRHLERVGLSRFPVPTWLQPSLELAVKDQENVARLRVDDEGGPRQVAVPARPIEQPPAARDVAHDALLGARVVGVDRDIPLQLLEERLPGCGAAHRQGPTSGTLPLAS